MYVPLGARDYLPRRPVMAVRGLVAFYRWVRTSCRFLLLLPAASLVLRESLSAPTASVPGYSPGTCWCCLSLPVWSMRCTGAAGSSLMTGHHCGSRGSSSTTATATTSTTSTPPTLPPGLVPPGRRSSSPTTCLPLLIRSSTFLASPTPSPLLLTC